MKLSHILIMLATMLANTCCLVAEEPVSPSPNGTTKTWVIRQKPPLGIENLDPLLSQAMNISTASIFNDDSFEEIRYKEIINKLFGHYDLFLALLPINNQQLMPAAMTLAIPIDFYLLLAKQDAQQLAQQNRPPVSIDQMVNALQAAKIAASNFIEALMAAREKPQIKALFEPIYNAEDYDQLMQTYKETGKALLAEFKNLKTAMVNDHNFLAKATLQDIDLATHPLNNTFKKIATQANLFAPAQEKETLENNMAQKGLQVEQELEKTLGLTPLFEERKKRGNEIEASLPKNASFKDLFEAVNKDEKYKQINAQILKINDEYFKKTGTQLADITYKTFQDEKEKAAPKLKTLDTDIEKALNTVRDNPEFKQAVATYMQALYAAIKKVITPEMKAHIIDMGTLVQKMAKSITDTMLKIDVPVITAMKKLQAALDKNEALMKAAQQYADAMENVKKLLGVDPYAVQAGILYKMIEL